ncbi:hypothetical protein J6590_068434 [Homalodisca vitripennis]|nr:hypothetical protein J6590_068434 [Homalodisca vitripennis]
MISDTRGLLLTPITPSITTSLVQLAIISPDIYTARVLTCASNAILHFCSCNHDQRYPWFVVDTYYTINHSVPVQLAIISPDIYTARVLTCASNAILHFCSCNHDQRYPRFVVDTYYTINHSVPVQLAIVSPDIYTARVLTCASNAILHFCSCNHDPRYPRFVVDTYYTINHSVPVQLAIISPDIYTARVLTCASNAILHFCSCSHDPRYPSCNHDPRYPRFVVDTYYTINHSVPVQLAIISPDIYTARVLTCASNAILHFCSCNHDPRYPRFVVDTYYTINHSVPVQLAIVSPDIYTARVLTCASNAILHFCSCNHDPRYPSCNHDPRYPRFVVDTYYTINHDVPVQLAIISPDIYTARVLTCASNAILHFCSCNHDPRYPRFVVDTYYTINHSVPVQLAIVSPDIYTARVLTCASNAILHFCSCNHDPRYPSCNHDPRYPRFVVDTYYTINHSVPVQLAIVSPDIYTARVLTCASNAILHFCSCNHDPRYPSCNHDPRYPRFVVDTSPSITVSLYS